MRSNLASTIARTGMLVIAGTICLASLVAPRVAHATNPNGLWDDSPYAKWYDEQYNADYAGNRQMGGSCCLIADGHPFEGSYTINRDGSVKLDDLKIVIPASRVLDGSTLTFLDNTGATIVRGGQNPTGHPVIWSSDPDIAHATIYCFSPGTLG